MRITQWGEYGILFSIFLAEKSRDGQPVVSAVEIAEAQGIALQYTQQILLRLREGKIIDSLRGPRGGYRLAKDPEDISLRDVLIASEGDTLELICETKPLNSERCNATNECVLRPIWYGLRDTVDTYLSDISIKTLLDRQGQASNPVTIDSPVTIGYRKESEDSSDDESAVTDGESL